MYKFIELAYDILKETAASLTIKEIWDAAVEKGLDAKLRTTGKTPTRTLGARIYVDITHNPRSGLIQVSQRPARFAFAANYGDMQESTPDSPPKTKKIPFRERDLHALLSSFVYGDKRFECRTRTIFHEYSRNRIKGYNKWLHPDLVGVHYPFEEYQANTLRLLDALKSNPYLLFSFEMKITIDFANLRECYFQAVSNSSWAHEGYLVALNIEDDPDFIDELSRLNNAFGIGVIRLNPNNISQSEILLPSRRRDALDWSTVDRLVYENPDFKSFIDGIMDDITIGKVRSTYDSIFDDDTEAFSYSLAKGICSP